jgi:hypothetical protein
MLDYMVDAQDGKDAFRPLRSLMRDRFPEAISPIQVRWTKGEPAFLSPHRDQGDVLTLRVGSEGPGLGPLPARCHRTLRPFVPRPHWGKMNYLGHRLFRQAYPQRQRFLELRRELDPAGLFLNDYSRTCWVSHAGKMVSLLGG